MPIDADYLYRSINYVDKAYHLFADKLNLTGLQVYPIDWCKNYVGEIDAVRDEHQQDKDERGN